MGEALAPVLERMFAPVEVMPDAGADLVAGVAPVPVANGLDVSTAKGFSGGDRVAALVQFSTPSSADYVTHQVEVTVTANGTEAVAGSFTDSPGFDGERMTLTTVARSGLLMTPELMVPAGTSSLTVAVRFDGGQVQLGRVALVKIK